MIDKDDKEFDGDDDKKNLYFSQTRPGEEDKEEKIEENLIRTNLTHYKKMVSNIEIMNINNNLN